MCFTHYNDWYASVWEDGITTHDADLHCHECGGAIPAGDAHYYVFAQEHEDEGPPLDDEDNEIAGPWREEDEFDPGNVDEYQRCLYCHRLIKAIEQEELARGCGHDESRPGLCELKDALWEARDDCRAYAARARAMWTEEELPTSHLLKVMRRLAPEEGDG